MLDETTKSSLEIDTTSIKTIINDLNTDRTLILNGIVNDSLANDNMVYVSSIEGMIRQLISYQNLLEKNN